MGADQRNAIRRALNEDAEKLLQEGDPNDPQLRRLKREIDEVNRLFDEFERRASGESELLLQCCAMAERVITITLHNSRKDLEPCYFEGGENFLHTHILYTTYE